MTTHITIEGDKAQSEPEYYAVMGRVLRALAGLVGTVEAGLTLSMYHVEIQRCSETQIVKSILIKLRDQGANLITGEPEIGVIRMLAKRLSTLIDGFTLFREIPVVFNVCSNDDDSESLAKISTAVVCQTGLKPVESPTPTTTAAASSTAEASTTKAGAT